MSWKQHADEFGPPIRHSGKAKLDHLNGWSRPLADRENARHGVPTMAIRTLASPALFLDNWAQSRRNDHQRAFHQMRQIGSLDSETLAQRFVDFLKTIDISAQVDEDDDKWLIWVRDENQLELAREELGKFQADSEAERYREAGQRASEIRAAEIQQRMAVKKNLHKVRGNWSGPISKRAPVVMWLMIGCVAAAIFSARFWNDNAAPSLVDSTLKFANLYDAQWDGTAFFNVRSGQIWRIITPIFLHGGPTHIAMNLYMLYVFGTRIEPKLGSPRFLGLVLATAIVPNLMQAVITGPNFVGISGVVYGLIGYMLVRRKDGYYISQFLLIIVGAFFVIDLFNLVPGRHVAVWAHVGGFVVGALYGYLPELMRGMR